MPDSVYSASEFYTGQIGDFLAVPIPPEPEGLREPDKLLYASPRTAQLLRECYDLEITGSPFIDDGQVWVVPKPRLIEDFPLPTSYVEPRDIGPFPFEERERDRNRNLVIIASV